MAKKMRWIAPLMLAVSMLLCACGGKMDGAGAQAYAKSCLDACYKGEFTEYLEQTDSTEEEAQALYDEGIQNTMDASGFTDAGVSEELQDKYRQFFIDLYKSANYTVAEGVEDGEDGYTVEVTVEPFTIFDDLEESLMAELEAKTAEMTEVPSDQELNEMIYQTMYDLLTAQTGDMEYGEPETVTLHVVPDEDGVYYIPEEDLLAVENALVQ